MSIISQQMRADLQAMVGQWCREHCQVGRITEVGERLRRGTERADLLRKGAPEADDALIEQSGLADRRWSSPRQAAGLSELSLD